MADAEGFFDDSGRWWPKNAEWCDRCQGMGTEDCDCGGDFCCCGAYDSLPCRRCHGEGYWIPTPADIAARQRTAQWMKEVWDKVPSTHQPTDDRGAGEVAQTD